MTSFAGILSGSDEQLPSFTTGRGVKVYGLNWMKPDSWPSSIDITLLADDFQTLLGDGWQLFEGQFPVLKLRLGVDVTVPEMDPDDDRSWNSDTGGQDDSYMRELRSWMKRGQALPPVVVGDDRRQHGTTHGLPYDGRHRLNAAKALKLKWIPAIDLQGFKHS